MTTLNGTPATQSELEIYQQKTGERSPITDQLVDILKGLEPDEIATYAALSELVHDDVQFKKRYMLNQALAIVKKDYDIVTECVRGVGYRRIGNQNIASKANSFHQKRLESDNERYQSTLDCIDPTALDIDGKTDYMLGRTICSIRQSIADKGTQKQLKAKISQDPIAHLDKNEILATFWGKG